jgi:hypothetical protein
MFAFHNNQGLGLTIENRKVVLVLAPLACDNQVWVFLGQRCAEAISYIQLGLATACNPRALIVMVWNGLHFVKSRDKRIDR